MKEVAIVDEPSNVKTPGQSAVAWSGQSQLGQPVASGVYLIQFKVRSPEMGEVVPALKKGSVIR